MRKCDMKKMLSDAINPHQICRVYFKYDYYYSYYFPLKVSERLFLGAKEDDFILDGYSIRRFQDVRKTEIKDDKCLEICKAEGLLDQITVPDVDVSDWKAAFTSLQKIGKNIAVEKESLDDEEWEFWLGKIEKVLSDRVRIRPFDADGIWYEEQDIKYSEITSVTFGSRYVEVFSKYLESLEVKAK